MSHGRSRLMKSVLTQVEQRVGKATDAQLLMALFAAALLLRALAALLVANFSPGVQIWEYGAQGRCAAQTHGDLCMRDPAGAPYASALMPPLTSYLWRELFVLFGDGGGALIAYVVLNVSCGALSAPLLFAFARRIGVGRPAALLAGLCICFYPTFVLVSATYHATNFTIALLLAGATLLVVALQRMSWRMAIVAGVFVGLSAMTRNELLLAAAAAATLFLWFGRKSLRAAFVAAAAFSLGVGAVAAPWIVRNEVVFHRFIPGGSQSGLNLWFAFGPYARASGNQLDDDPVSHAARDAIQLGVPRGDGPGDRYEDRVQRAYAADAAPAIRDGGLARLASLTAQKAMLLLVFDWTDPLTHSPAYWLPWLVANGLAWFALIQTLRGRGLGLDPRGGAVIGVFVGAMSLAYAITGIFSRYRMHIEPFEFVFAAMGAWMLLNGQWRTKTAPAPV